MKSKKCCNVVVTNSWAHLSKLVTHHLVSRLKEAFLPSNEIRKRQARTLGPDSNHLPAVERCNVDC